MERAFNPLKSLLNYSSSNIMTKFCLPRKYTSTHSDETGEIFLAVDKKYYKPYLENEESQKVESQVIGKWVKKKNKYKILLKVVVSSEKNPNAKLRYDIYQRELPHVLKTIALAESCTMKHDDNIKKAKIYVKFDSIDPKYQKVQYWGRLSKWAK